MNVLYKSHIDIGCTTESVPVPESVNFLAKPGTSQVTAHEWVIQLEGPRGCGDEPEAMGRWGSLIRKPWVLIILELLEKSLMLEVRIGRLGTVTSRTDTLVLVSLWRTPQ